MAAETHNRLVASWLGTACLLPDSAFEPAIHGQWEELLVKETFE